MSDAIQLTEISTKDLLNELITREGVDVGAVPPHSTLEHKVEGPAIVISVID